tara:strand:+ start:977 stop:1078 length:102 start_codon:yes stop_codon:yes gene_type:complete
MVTEGIKSGDSLDGAEDLPAGGLRLSSRAAPSD